MRRYGMILLILWLFLVGCGAEPVTTPAVTSDMAGLITEDESLIAAADGAICEQVQVNPVDAGHVSVVCISATPVPTPTITPSPTATTTPTPTHTHPAETATATVAAATSTPAPVEGELCPAWVHDLYKVAGPDGLLYPTWHPQIDPVYSCHFGHDHGVDPATSTVNPSLPPFGYINKVSMDAGTGHPAEPHAGFKVFVWACGTPGDQGENRIAGRLVIHMGTSGTARYTVPHHSVHYSAAACNGTWSLDVQGMVDFPGIGSICGPRAGRDFSTLGCVQEGESSTAYEIWTGNFQVKYPGEFTGLFQARAYVQLYQGPVSLNNRNRPTQYVTDVFGNVLLDAVPGDVGTLVQSVSAHRVDGTNSNASANGSQFKQVFDLCSSVIKAPN